MTDIAYLWPHQLIERNRARYQRTLNLGDEFNLHLVLKKGEDWNPEVIDSAHSIHVSPVESGNQYIDFFFYYLYALFTLGGLVIKNDLEAVHTFPGPNSQIGFLSKYLFGITWVADVLDDPAVELDALENRRPLIKFLVYSIHVQTLKFNLRFADAVFVVGWETSQGLPRKIIEEYHLQPTQVVPVPNGVDLSATKPTADSKPSSTFTLFYVGSMQSIRGLDVLLEAVAHATKEIDLELKLLGPVRYERDEFQIREKLDNLGIEDQVEFPAKRIPHSEVLKEMEKADVCLLPLSPHFDNFKYTFPIKLFEYLAMSKPVIASDLPGISEVIDHGDNGLLADPTKSEKFSEAIIKVHDNDDLRHELTENSRSSIEGYDWETIHQQVVETYRHHLS